MVFGFFGYVVGDYCVKGFGDVWVDGVGLGDGFY